MKLIVKFKIGIDQQTLRQLTEQAERSGLETKTQKGKTPLQHKLCLVKENAIWAWLNNEERPQYDPGIIPTDRLMAEHQMSLDHQMHKQLKELAARQRLSLRQLCYDILYLQANFGKPDGKSLPDLSKPNGLSLSNTAIMARLQGPSVGEPAADAPFEEWEAYYRSRDQKKGGLPDVSELPAGVLKLVESTGMEKEVIPEKASDKLVRERAEEVRKVRVPTPQELLIPSTTHVDLNALPDWVQSEDDYKKYLAEQGKQNPPSTPG